MAGREVPLYRTCQHNRVIHSTFLRARTSLRGQREFLASRNVTARWESQNRSSGNPREILETDVSANESIWRTSRRQGEAPYYTPHSTPPRALRHRLLHLLFLLSPSGSSASSAIVVVTAFCHLSRLSSPIPRSLNPPRAAARSASARTSSPQGWDLSDGSTLIVILSRALYNDRMLGIILGVRIFR